MTNNQGEKILDYWRDDVHIYVETLDNGDKLVSEYSKSYQRAYVRPKKLLDYWSNPNE